MKNSHNKEKGPFGMVPVIGEVNIKVIGVGGGGGNSVKRMMDSGVQGVEFICANTDNQALMRINASTNVQLGQRHTKGLGAGGCPEKGREAAEEDRGYISEIIDGTDLLFITAGMGGGTGTGAAPVVAEIAREKGILTVAVVTLPFDHERRTKKAMEGLKVLDQQVNSLIAIPNEKLMEAMEEDISQAEAFLRVDGILMGAVRGIADLIRYTGEVNLDFADVCAVMGSGGRAIMGSGRARGENRAEEALEQALHNPLLEGVNYRQATGVLVNISVGSEHSLLQSERKKIGNTIAAKIPFDKNKEETSHYVGTVVNPELEDDLQVTIIIAGVSYSSERGGLQGQAPPGQGGSSLQARRPPSSEYLSIIRGRSKQDYREIPAVLRKQVD